MAPPSHLAAAATSAMCAVGQDTPYSEATSETARLPDAIGVATRSRSRSLTRPPSHWPLLNTGHDHPPAFPAPSEGPR